MVDERTKSRVDRALIDYYSMNDPSMTDEEFDTLYELVYPGELPFDTFSQIFSGKGRRRSLKKPMLSLAKVRDSNELSRWVSSMKSHGYSKIMMVPKFDGAACLIETDENGSIVSAITRGDGKIGQDITYVVSNIECEELEKNSLIQVEITLLNDKMEEANKLSVESGGEEYSKYRAVASGLLRKTGKTAKKGAKFLSINKHFSSTSDSVEINIDENSTTDIINQINNYYDDTLKDMSVETDGVVLYVTKEDSKPDTSLGNKEKTPRWAVAWKYPDEAVKSVLRDVVWQENRQKNTPVAIFDTVRIDNSDVSRASLHNIDFIHDLDLAIGDTLHITLANKIIPKVVGSEKAPDEKDRIEIVPPTSASDDMSIPALTSLAKNMLTSLDITASGEKAIKGFAQYAYDSFPDDEPIIKLYKTLEDMSSTENIKKIPLFVSKKGNSVTKNGQMFSDSAKETLGPDKSQILPGTVLQSMGVPTWGSIISRDIMNIMSPKEMLSNLHDRTFPSIKGIGEVRENYLYKNYDDISHIFKNYFPWMLKDDYQGKIENKDDSLSKLSGMTFVVTGKFDISRKDIQELIESLGGKLSGTVSRDVDKVITSDADSSSSKIKKARNLEIDIEEVSDIRKYLESIN